MTDEGRERSLDRLLDIALDNRKLEIDLLWRRNTAFWLFVAAIAAAVGATLKEHPLIAVALSAAGLLSSSMWYLVNRSGKAWQTSWEVKAEYLLQQRYGERNLFIRWVEDEPDHLRKPPKRYSVSGLLGALSLYVTCFWTGLLAYLLCIYLMRAVVPSFDRYETITKAVAIAAFVAFTAMWLFCVLGQPNDLRRRRWRLRPDFLGCRREDKHFVVVREREVCQKCSKP